MSIQVDVQLRRGAFALAAAFEAGPGLTALFGRSGSGKTTFLNQVGCEAGIQNQFVPSNPE